MENNANGTTKIREVLFGESRMWLHVFLIGTGVVIWAYNMFLSPLQGVKGDIALIQQSIQTIQLNHEQHLQDAVTQISRNTEDIKEMRGDQLELTKTMVRLQTLLETKFGVR